ncbi:MAG: cupin domain-containing protein [Deltaproteobacteria bacterium]|nr:cupin domain-containing protein [Deltaproteobacteria bacterium]
MSMRKIEKPWGHELIFAHTQKYAGKILYIKKGEKLSYQYHNNKEETILLYKGKMLFEFEKENTAQSLQLNPGDTFHIPPKMKHRMSALEECEVFEVSSPELEDVVRLKDAYGRCEK